MSVLSGVDALLRMLLFSSCIASNHSLMIWRIGVYLYLSRNKIEGTVLIYKGNVVHGVARRTGTGGTNMMEVLTNLFKRQKRNVRGKQEELEPNRDIGNLTTKESNG